MLHALHPLSAVLEVELHTDFHAVGVVLLTGGSTDGQENLKKSVMLEAALTNLSLLLRTRDFSVS